MSASDELILYEDEILMKKLPMAKTGVFWNVDDFPIPKEDIVLFPNNIKKSLKKAGFLSDDVSIKAYGENEPDEFTKHHYDNAGITFASRGTKGARLFKMLSDLVLWEGVARRSGGPTNMMLITKDFFAVEDLKDFFQKEEFEDLKGSGFVSYINTLYALGPNTNILFVVPQVMDPTELLAKLPYSRKYQSIPILNCVWRWESLCVGGEPAVYKRKPRFVEYDDNDDDDDDRFSYADRFKGGYEEPVLKYWTKDDGDRCDDWW